MALIEMSVRSKLRKHWRGREFSLVYFPLCFFDIWIRLPLLIGGALVSTEATQDEMASRGHEYGGLVKKLTQNINANEELALAA